MLIIIQRRRRLWIIDRFLASIAQDHREELGQWIRRKLNGAKGIVQETKRVQKIITACAVDEDVLRDEWENQVEVQTSICARKWTAYSFEELLIIFW